MNKNDKSGGREALGEWLLQLVLSAGVFAAAIYAAAALNGSVTL